jgi:hypothetical protein
MIIGYRIVVAPQSHCASAEPGAPGRPLKLFIAGIDCGLCDGGGLAAAGDAGGVFTGEPEPPEERSRKRRQTEETSRGPEAIRRTRRFRK